MFNAPIIDAFLDDPTVILIAVLVALDFLFGVYVAGKSGTFRLSYVADVFRNDVLGKMLPYYTLWAALHVTQVDWSPWGFDVIEESAGAVVIGALGGSVLNSLRDLGLAKSLPDTLAGPDPETPTPPAS